MTILRKTAAALVIAAISLAGCKSTPTMTMTTAMKGELKFWMAGTGEAVIDRGDGGIPETVTLSATTGGFTDAHRYTHIFPDKTSRTIVIKGQNITHLFCTALQLTALDVTKNSGLTFLNCGDNRLTGLDVRNNTGLKELLCYSNRLTHLDVRNNTVLMHLHCSGNRIPAGGLNALFGTLHDSAGVKKIYIAGNPGAAGCDRSIAEGKGWEVY